MRPPEKYLFALVTSSVLEWEVVTLVFRLCRGGIVKKLHNSALLLSDTMLGNNVLEQ
jgi:hypothetical protein